MSKSNRQHRSTSWLIQQALQISRSELTRVLSTTHYLSRDDEEEAKAKKDLGEG